MYRSSSKLPNWQPSPPPPYRRNPLTRRSRFLIILAIIALAWYRYGPSAASDAAVDTVIDLDIPKTFPHQKIEQHRIVSPHDVEPIEEVAAPAQVHPPALLQRDEEGKPAEEQPAPLLPESEDVHILPATVDPDHIPEPDHVSEPPKAVTPEYAEDEALPRQAIVDRRRKPVAAEVNGGQEVIDHEAPVLVKQAAEKMLEQHLAPAAKYEEEKMETLSSPQAGPPKFPPYSEYAALDEKAEVLPDIVHIPFEEATADIELDGWEDEWFAGATLDAPKWGNISEPKIDFVYTWVNGSDIAFQETIYPYEVNSTLNDVEGKWLAAHRVNRYRDWDELRYSIRSVEKYASSFRGKIQLLVNAVADPIEAAKATVLNPATIVGKQRPLWLNTKKHTLDTVQILSQEDFFDDTEQGCLPTFNSLTIENQIFNTKSDTDRVSSPRKHRPSTADR
jgi:hypothetical protein